jgi:cobyrinic acid a,c-diamide synthase
MPKTTIPRIVVSGLRGGSGKTILSVSLNAIWQKNGVRVAPFKKGPDYIDAGWLALAADRPCYNLDLFMMEPRQALRSFIDHTTGSDIAVIEGNRGLYDGVDPKGSYSTAELSKLLSSPVIIVVDCTKVTGTVAAMVLGCQKLDPGVMIGGVVLNNIASTRQESVIRNAVEQRCGLPVLGAIPRMKQDPFPERHMGLTPFQEHKEIKGSISMVRKIGEDFLDLNGIRDVAESAVPLDMTAEKPTTVTFAGASSPRIGVVRDSAFQFYYPDNFEELVKQGAEIIEVSALTAKVMPEIDVLYIGGGFPETHAIALEENRSFKISLLKAIEDGLPVYAECGGLMYLGDSIHMNNNSYPMVGALPLVFELDKKPQAHGYTVVEVTGDNPYFPKGSILKGHEFHYSRLVEIKGEDGVNMAFKLQRGKGIKDSMDGITYKNVFATYTHLHAIGSPEWTRGIMAAACKFRER